MDENWPEKGEHGLKWPKNGGKWVVGGDNRRLPNWVAG
jgi:hypothetical protein